jgi:16S rRNA (cytidine1402-2'-O)-methyltransferase
MSIGTLYIVATPIGNLEDITLRALRILREVDMIAAEDTRHSRKLLTHFGISRPLTSYFDHNKDIKGTVILDKLRNGMSVALISDAGTPCISDPGYQLVRDAVNSGIAVIPIPGACAAVAALSASGLPTDSFSFEGFLPNRSGKRREKLAKLKGDSRVLIFYEAPTRIIASLRDIHETMGDREVVLAREITKVYEEFLRGRISHVLERLSERQVKGEIVLMLAPAESVAHKPDDLNIEEMLDRYIADDGISVKDAVKKVALETGMPRSRVYEAALRLKS